MLVLVGFAFVSLATWSITDPSFSNANDGTIQNSAGFAGAALADLAMQFCGLAAAIALMPPALWGWMSLMQKPIGHMRKRLVAWPIGVVLFSAAFGCLTIPASWPLPSGLGGVIGDLILKLPAMITGSYPQGVLAGVLFAVFAIPGVGAIFLATGLTGNKSAVQDDPIDAEQEDEDAGGGSAMGWLFGALTHLYLMSRARSRRKKAAKLGVDASDLVKRADLSRDGIEPQPKKSMVRSIFGGVKSGYEKLMSPPDDGLEIYDHAARQEPGFAAGGGAFTQYGQIGSNQPDYGENIYAHDDASVAQVDERWRQQTPFEMPHQETSSERVQPIADKPKPSTRMSREAQPSFIQSDNFELPSLHFLGEAQSIAKDASLSNKALEQNARMLEGVLDDFGVKGKIINVRPGPVVTLYELEPAPGIKSSRVIGLADDIARSMSAIAARVAVVPGRNAIGIELPNQRRETVYLREMLASVDYEKTKAKLPIVLGKTIGGEPTIVDLAKMPHLLMAGTTGSGKSVAINTMILSILYKLTPDQVKMIMIDPKMLELSIYDGIPHLLTPVVTDPKKAVVALKWTVREMEERYKKMSKLNVRNIDGYNTRLEQVRKKGESMSRTIQTGYDRDTGEAIYETEQLDLEPLPYIVVIIDEMADLMMVAGKDIEGTVQRLAQMARAAGIHVVMATQRPSVDVITGTIKANFPTRISFQVTSKIDSRTILGEQGAEQLLGMGDMLYMAGGGRIQRVHGPFVADDEVERIVNHLKSQGVPQYLEAVTVDADEGSDAGGGSDAAGGLSESNDIYDQAVAIVLRDRKASTSYIQRRLSIGYNRAASLIERMEKEGLISSANHAGKREILVPDENETI
ncbi:MAG: cell division protein FtsK [Hyphomicrobiales bacterium]|nr:MAG: cell division protein FtsK [Hyphomicrobiales bacterium]